MPEVGHQGGLGRLVFHITTQVSAAQTAAQPLLGVGEEVHYAICLPVLPRVVSNPISLDGSQIIPAGVSRESQVDSFPQGAINGRGELY